MKQTRIFVPSLRGVNFGYFVSPRVQTPKCQNSVRTKKQRKKYISFFIFGIF